jgi:hypothetical protein
MVSFEVNTVAPDVIKALSPQPMLYSQRRLSGKKSTFGAGLNATCILPHWGDQWAKLRGTSVTDTKICIGILESLFRVTCLKAAKAFIGIEQNELDVPPAETYCDT